MSESSQKSQTLRRRARLSTVVTVLASFGIAACLGLVIYAATSVTFLASEPMADPRFGPQTACALKALKGTRTGFTVGVDGAVALYSESEIALCGAGQKPEPRRFELGGIQSAAMDFDGTLWVSRTKDGEAELLKLSREGSGFESAGELGGILVGTAHGVVGLDSSARLVSVSGDGSVTGIVSLPERQLWSVEKPPRLLVNSDGTLVLVVAYSGIFVFDAQTLDKVRAEAPCNVEWAWWLQSDDLLLSCGPNASWSLKLNARTGEREQARLPHGRPSVRVPGIGTYVEDCGALPCSTNPPG
ncbi:MAG: hypothetical protein ACJ790_14965 [Myxococcaceae bacterium]